VYKYVCDVVAKMLTNKLFAVHTIARDVVNADWYYCVLLVQCPIIES
jgi:hypothetical protein